MNSKTLLIGILIGTRPEAIKQAPLVIEAANNFSQIRPVVICTGQHREMARETLSDFGIKIDVDLDIMKQGQTLSYILGSAVQKLDNVLTNDSFDAILVQGDTTSTLAGALAGFHRNIPVGHVEAGLRTYNLKEPFPEELNRQLVSRAASYHFAPTQSAKDALIKENISPEKIWVTGNTVIDSLNHIAADRRCTAPSCLNDEILRRPFFLVTCHRRENRGTGISAVCAAVTRLIKAYPEISCVFPTHPSPHVRQPVLEHLSGIDRVFVTDPFEYSKLVWCLKNAHFVLTDSGGIQEEAPTFGTPVLVARETSERSEGITAGCARLVGTNEELIVKECSRLMDETDAYASMANSANPYGDGTAAQSILNILEQNLF